MSARSKSHAKESFSTPVLQGELHVLGEGGPGSALGESFLRNLQRYLGSPLYQRLSHWDSKH